MMMPIFKSSTFNVDPVDVEDVCPEDAGVVVAGDEEDVCVCCDWFCELLPHAAKVSNNDTATNTQRIFFILIPPNNIFLLLQKWTQSHP